MQNTPQVTSHSHNAMALAVVLLPRFNMMSLTALLEPMRVGGIRVFR